ncbi:MAG: hypothetical protein F6K20_21960, partial [Moorea sp. SIO2C4]|nr:hypothetical protein [Moorena sp. SIO2C4]
PSQLECDALKEPLRERMITISTGMRCSERAATRTHDYHLNWNAML